MYQTLNIKRMFFAAVSFVIALSCFAQYFIPNSAVNSDLINKTVSVQGKITNIVPPRSDNSPYGIYIDDDTEVLRVVIFPDVYSEIDDPGKFALNTRVKVTGKVSEYRGNLEISLKSGKDIVLYAGPPANAVVKEKPEAATDQREPAVKFVPTGPITSISTITTDMKDSKVAIQGKVVGFRQSNQERTPSIVSIKDDSGQIDVVYWADVGDSIPAHNKPRTGAEFHVKGTVNVFRDKPQIKLQNAEDINLLVPNSTSATKSKIKSTVAASVPPSDVKYTDIDIITRNMVGQPIAVKGKVTRVIPVGGGKLVEITDNTGSIMVPHWESTVGSSPYWGQLREGARIAVKGEVDFYEKRSQIQVKLTGPEDLLWME